MLASPPPNILDVSFKRTFNAVNAPALGVTMEFLTLVWLKIIVIIVVRDGEKV